MPSIRLYVSLDIPGVCVNVSIADKITYKENTVRIQQQTTYCTANPFALATDGRKQFLWYTPSAVFHP
jgi:hypothetical protein